MSRQIQLIRQLPKLIQNQPKNVIRDKIDFKLPPLLKTDADGYLRDSRKGQRQVINADWKPLKPSTAKFRVEIAGPEDKLLVSQYLTEGFAKHLNICAAIKMKFEDLAPVSYGWVDEMIDNNNTYCVFADDRLVSVFTTVLYERKDFPRVFRNGVGIPTADVDFELLPDYAEFIKSGPFTNHKANQFDAILDVCNTYVGHQMPDHVQKALYIDALFIDPKLHKMGLGEYMLTTGLRRGVEQGAQMSYVFAVATGTQKVYLSQPGPCKLLVIPYDKFLENGKPVFQKLNDGAKTCVTIIKEFKQN